MLELHEKHQMAIHLQSADCTLVWLEVFSCPLGYSGSFDIFLQNVELKLSCKTNLHFSFHRRYAWEAHRGGKWAAVVAAGIPFGLGAFVLFVGVPFSSVKTRDF